MKKDEQGLFCFNILSYTITADKYQFIVNGARKTKGKNAKGVENSWSAAGYYRCLSSALSDILELEMRFATVDTKTLEEAINAMQKVAIEFNKLIAPLRKLEGLEDITIYGKNKNII